MTLPDHIRAAIAALSALEVPDDAPPAIESLLMDAGYHLKAALADAGMAVALLETLRPMSDEDVARIIKEAQDGE